MGFCVAATEGVPQDQEQDQEHAPRRTVCGLPRTKELKVKVKSEDQEQDQGRRAKIKGESQKLVIIIMYVATAVKYRTSGYKQRLQYS